MKVPYGFLMKKMSGTKGEWHPLGEDVRVSLSPSNATAPIM